MAIEITSGNVFAQDNPKIRDNKIDGIELGQVKPSIKEDVNITAFRGNYDTSKFELNVGNLNAKSDKRISGTTIAYAENINYLRLSPYNLTFSSSNPLEIPKKQGEKYISKLYSGVDAEGVPNIKYSIQYSIATYAATAEVSIKTGLYDEPDMSTAKLENLKIATNPDETPKSQYGTFPAEIKFADNGLLKLTPTDITYSINRTYEYQTSNSSFPVNNKNSSKTQNKTNVGTCSIFEDDNKFRLYPVIFSGFEIVDLNFADGWEKTGANPYPTGNRQMTGKCYRYKPSSVNITINGETVQLLLENVVTKIGNLTNNPFKVSGNELMQTTNKYIDSHTGETSDINQEFAKTILRYKNGKETATLKCGIAIYYDEQQNIAITPYKYNRLAPMTFKMYDKVYPSYYGADGKEHPLSKYADGTPKLFEIIAINFIYDGAIWQELTIQEVSK